MLQHGQVGARTAVLVSGMWRNTPSMRCVAHVVPLLSRGVWSVVQQREKAMRLHDVYLTCALTACGTALADPTPQTPTAEEPATAKASPTPAATVAPSFTDVLRVGKAGAKGLIRWPRDQEDLKQLGLEARTLQAGDVVGTMAARSGYALVMHFESGAAVWVPERMLDADRAWVPGGILQRTIPEGSCGSERQVEARVLAYASEDDAWVWWGNKPCHTALVEEVQASQTTVYVTPGEEVTLTCEATPMTPLDEKPLDQMAAGVVSIAAPLSGDRVAVVSNGRTVAVPTHCGAEGRLLAADISEQAAIPQGDGVAVVHFWATYCKPCIEELPVYAGMVAELGRERTLAVSSDRNVKIAHKYLAEHGFDVPAGMDRDMRLLRKLGGDGTLPFTAIRDREGTWTGHRGVVDWQGDIEIRQLLGLALPDLPAKETAQPAEQPAEQPAPADAASDVVPPEAP